MGLFSTLIELLEDPESGVIPGYVSYSEGSRRFDQKSNIQSVCSLLGFHDVLAFYIRRIYNPGKGGS